jgi:hypothetical protein
MILLFYYIVHKTGLLIITVVAVLVISIAVSPLAIAAPNENASDVAKNRVAQIPKNAVEIEPGLFFTGFSQDPDGTTVGGLLYVYYPKENAKPSWAGGNKDKTSSSSCFEFISKGLKWTSPSSYIIDPRFSSGDLLNGEFETIIRGGTAEWNSHVEDKPFGLGTVGDVNEPTWDNDGKNEIFFADISQPGVIAAVQVYGVWWGPPSQRHMTGQDLIFDNVDFQWTNVGRQGGSLVGPKVMDLENIAQHELGHSAALSHPEDSCTDETMYRYASAGETKKRDLNDGDIAGIKKLYS